MTSSSVRCGVLHPVLSLNLELHCQMTRRYLSVLCQTFEPYHAPQHPHWILDEKMDSLNHYFF